MDLTSHIRRVMAWLRIKKPALPSNLVRGGKGRLPMRIKLSRLMAKEAARQRVVPSRLTRDIDPLLGLQPEDVPNRIRQRPGGLLGYYYEREMSPRLRAKAKREVDRLLTRLSSGRSE